MKLSDKLYIATIAEDAVDMIRQYHTGVEINEFCTASNMDGEDFTYWDGVVRNKLACSEMRIFHAPFSELHPSAVDPLAVKLAMDRYNQAYRLANGYGIRRMVVHSGYVPLVYFKNWFHDRSVEFWKAFMADKPGEFSIMIENVLDDEPSMLKGIIEKIADPRIKVCLDLGHAHVMSGMQLEEWINELAPYIAHVHIHNNDKNHDRHWELGRGTIDMEQILHLILDKVPQATMTVENLKCEPSMLWLAEKGFLRIRI